MTSGSDASLAAKTGVRYDDLQEGQTCEVRRRLTGEAIDAFAQASGDHNPLHVDRDFAIAAGFGDRIAHGMLLASWISAALAEHLPGRGTLYLRQSLEFRQAALPGDELLVRLSVSEKKRRGRVILSCLIINEATGKELLRGSAEVIAPS
ncbi:MAG: MaoC family dehydratase [Pseudomonadota bacterium]